MDQSKKLPDIETEGIDMAYELVPSVQAVLDIFPEKKKDGFDRIMEIAHLFKDGTAGAVCGCISEAFQSYALMQGRRDVRRVMKYTCSLEETRLKHTAAMRRMDVEMRRLDLQEQAQWQQYDLQKSVLTLYVDRQFQRTVDQMTREFQSASRSIERERYRAIQEIDQYARSYMSGMDRAYQTAIREEELVCAAYRDVLRNMERQNISRNQVAAEISKIAVERAEKIDNEKFQIIFDTIFKMTEFQSISFEEYIRLRGDLTKRRFP